MLVFWAYRCLNEFRKGPAFERHERLLNELICFLAQSYWRTPGDSESLGFTYVTAATLARKGIKNKLQLPWRMLLPYLEQGVDEQKRRRWMAEAWQDLQRGQKTFAEPYIREDEAFHDFDESRLVEGNHDQVRIERIIKNVFILLHFQQMQFRVNPKYHRAPLN